MMVHGLTLPNKGEASSENAILPLPGDVRGPGSELMKKR